MGGRGACCMGGAAREEAAREEQRATKTESRRCKRSIAARRARGLRTAARRAVQLDHVLHIRGVPCGRASQAFEEGRRAGEPARAGPVDGRHAPPAARHPRLRPHVCPRSREKLHDGRVPFRRRVVQRSLLMPSSLSPRVAPLQPAHARRHSTSTAQSIKGHHRIHFCTELNKHTSCVGMSVGACLVQCLNKTIRCL
jgi:hypothetical protein